MPSSRWQKQPEFGSPYTLTIPPVRAIGPTARLFYSVDNLARAYRRRGPFTGLRVRPVPGTVSEMEGGAAAVLRCD